ncbi:MAG TPA: translocation/assembly module TamB, partial [Chryseobacterium sp.]
TRVKTFDLQNNNYAVNDINLDGLKLKLKQDLVKEVAANVEEKVDSLNQKKPMKLGLSGIKLTNFDIDYGDDNSKTFAKVLFKELSTKVNSIDLENNDYNVGNVYLTGANINANLFLPTENANPKEGKPEVLKNSAKEKAMKVLLGKLRLDDVKVTYNNTAIAPTKSGMDFNHLNFAKLNLDVRNFKMENNGFAGSVKSAEIQEARGLNVQKFNTDFVYGEKGAHLKNLYLQTPKTILRDEVVLNYNSIEQLSSNLGAVQISADIRDSKIGFSDILNLVPTLRNTAPFNKYPNATLNVNAFVRGTVNDLAIQNLKVSGLDQLKVLASGKIKNAMNPDQLYYDLNVAELSTASKTIYNLVPKNTIPKNITLPSFMTIRGTAKGTTQVVDTNLRLTSTLGNAAIIAKADLRRKNRETFDVKANLQSLQIGKIIQNKELGSITAQINAKGQGFDPKTMSANLLGDVKSATYKGYTYQNMNLKGKINRGAYDIDLNSKDPNANLHLAASGVFNDNPTVKVNGNINKLDLNKLGFYSSPMIIAGAIDGDFKSLDPDNLNGYLNLQNFAISDTKEVYPIQEIKLNA